MDHLQQAAEAEWWKLEDHDWIEAFSHHPRIGDMVPAGGWASTEQAGMHGSPDRTLKELEHLNRAYEQKFGHVFLIFATGKTAGQMLDALYARLGNGEDVELKNAAGEQAKITRLRLERLISAYSSLRSE